MDAEDAHTSMMTAAHPDDRGTPDALLGVGTDERIARDLSTIAVQRWESEGGAAAKSAQYARNDMALAE
jgi:hypothetical protein